MGVGETGILLCGVAGGQGLWVGEATGRLSPTGGADLYCVAQWRGARRDRLLFELPSKGEVPTWPS